MDISKITSSAKSWMYADMILKPEEMILVRPPTFGGLGMLDIKMKALAGLIRTFLETACIKGFRHSLYHKLLFQYHVLEDRNISDPGTPPLYSMDFFSYIRQANEESTLTLYGN